MQGINNYNCLVNENYDMQGNYYRSRLTYLEIKLWKCNNYTKQEYIKNPNIVCADPASINKRFKDESFSFAFVNSYFESTNYETPIQQFIDDGLFFELDPNVAKKANFFIQKSSISVQDKILQVASGPVEKEFALVKNIRTYDNDYSDEEGLLVAIYLRLDKQYDLYER